MINKFLIMLSFIARWVPFNKWNYLGMRISIYRFFAFPLDAAWANTVVAAGQALFWVIWGSLLDEDNRRRGLAADESFLPVLGRVSFVLSIPSKPCRFDIFESFFLALSDVIEAEFESPLERTLEVPVMY